MDSVPKLRYRLSTILIVIAIVSVPLAIQSARFKSLEKIQQLHEELELMLDDADLKAAFKSFDLFSSEELGEEYWVVSGPNGMRAIDGSLNKYPLKPIWSGEYVFEVGGPSCEIYLQFSRPWQIDLTSPNVTIEHLDGAPYEQLANYVEFVLVKKFGLPKPTRVIMEE